MAELRDVIAYIIRKYPSTMRDELSNARLTKIIYLADWRQAIIGGRQITNIEWYFDNYGPFVKDVEREASSNQELFSIDLGSNLYGQPKKKFSLRDKDYEPQLSEAEKNAIDHIIDVTKKLFWDDFIKLVYSTHPVASSERYSFLNLIEKAAEYKQLTAA